MTVTVEHDHVGLVDEVPMYRCDCGELFPDAGAAHQCRHRPRPGMRKSHDPAGAQLDLLEAR